MLGFAILPTLFSSFTFMKKGTLSISFAIFLFYQIFRYFKHQRVHDLIGKCLFSPKIDQSLTQMISQPPSDPFDYSANWSKGAMFSTEKEICRVQ